MNGPPPPIPPRFLKPTFTNLHIKTVGSVAVTDDESLETVEQQLETTTPELGVGAGLNAVRAASSSTLVTPVLGSVIAHDMVVRGSLTFDTALRLDGRFEGGKLSSSPHPDTGALTVGPTGVTIGEVSVGNLTVESGGCVVGNVTATTVVLLGAATVFGDVTCKGLNMGLEAQIMGHINVHRNVPGRLVVDVGEAGVVASAGVVEGAGGSLASRVDGEAAGQAQEQLCVGVAVAATTGNCGVDKNRDL